MIPTFGKTGSRHTACLVIRMPAQTEKKRIRTRFHPALTCQPLSLTV